MHVLYEQMAHAVHDERQREARKRHRYGKPDRRATVLLRVRRRRLRRLQRLVGEPVAPHPRPLVVR